jgi:zinc/manganese transport system substrate-binding protein
VPLTFSRRAALAGFAAATLAPWPVAAQTKLVVVATFSILGDFAARVGGDRIALTTLVGPDGDAHAHQASPADGKALAQARVIIANGLGFDDWIERLIRSSRSTVAVTLATEGVALRASGEDQAEPEQADEHGHKSGAPDPHAWQSVANAKIYVANIRDALIAADPDGKPTYDINAQTYLAQLDALDADVRTAVAAIPVERRKIITGHDSFGYFGSTYGLEFIAPQGVSTEAEASAKSVARIIRQIRATGAPAVFMENISDPRLIQRIADETGAKIGGVLYSDALSDDKGPAASYIDMVRHNLKQLSAALAP